MRSIATTICEGTDYANVHSLRCKLLAENMESLGTSFLQTLKQSFWFLWFAFVRVVKAVRGMNFIAVVMYRSQQRSRRGQRIDTSQRQEVAVASCLLRFTRRGS